MSIYGPRPVQFGVSLRRLLRRPEATKAAVAVSPENPHNVTSQEVESALTRISQKATMVTLNVDRHMATADYVSRNDGIPKRRYYDFVRPYLEKEGLVVIINGNSRLTRAGCHRIRISYTEYLAALHEKTREYLSPEACADLQVNYRAYQDALRRIAQRRGHRSPV